MAALLAHDIIIGAVFYVSTVIVILNIIGWLINIIGCLVASQAGWLAGRLPGWLVSSWLLGCLVSWIAVGSLVGLLPGWLDSSWLPGCLARGWLAGCLLRWLAGNIVLYL
jgi:hypothetical protein